MHAWSGTTFSPVLAALQAPTAASFHEGKDALVKLVEALFPGSIGWRVESSWLAGNGEAHYVVFRVGYPAPAHGFFSHDPTSREWESGRAIEMSEVWIARPGSFRRILALPTGLGSLAEPIRVLTLSVTGHGDELDVCGPGDRLIQGATDTLTPLEMTFRARDEAAAARMARGCGTYRFDGRSFVRRAALRGSSF